MQGSIETYIPPDEFKKLIVKANNQVHVEVGGERYKSDINFLNIAGSIRVSDSGDIVFEVSKTPMGTMIHNFLNDGHSITIKPRVLRRQPDEYESMKLIGCDVVITPCPDIPQIPVSFDTNGFKQTQE